MTLLNVCKHKALETANGDIENFRQRALVHGPLWKQLAACLAIIVPSPTTLETAQTGSQAFKTGV